jgi:hypothetical protein
MSDEYEVDELFADDGGTFDRQELLRRGAAAGLAIPTLSLLFGAKAAFARPSARALTPTFYQWIYNIHPDIPDTLNKQYAKKHASTRRSRRSRASASTASSRRRSRRRAPGTSTSA